EGVKACGSHIAKLARKTLIRVILSLIEVNPRFAVVSKHLIRINICNIPPFPPQSSESAQKIFLILQCSDTPNHEDN
ncbi:hypothetical protein, partial [uncultured Duncaniella sp.]|uniref:hypothetical protein n=1 Tax=uncultured Duncaniella sp. TaxID=2768039 RepID=UPI00260B68CF